jgi:hypothetical protein
MPNDIQVAVYYFPNYHPDPRNAQVHGSGWTEWDVVKRAVPRFPGHNQPRIPAWGYEDESDPQVMARKIDAAADHAINAFIFDWYWYDDGPFIERGLEKGFLGAPNNQRLDFAIMWANHNWHEIHPAKQIECLKGDYRLLYPGAVTPATFEAMTETVIQRYFKHPAYWKIDGAPYFSIYDLDRLVASFGSLEATRDALASFRARTRAAGFPDLHLNQVFWNNGILPGETQLRDPNALFKSLGYDSITSYVWIHHARLDSFPEYDYVQACEQYLHYWEKEVTKIDLPYFPNATMGWDSSPRTVQSDGFINAGYPFMPSLAGNTPQRFEQALRAIKTRLSANPHGPKILTINAWNEWTEGSYLEPDTHTGMQYLEAIHTVFRD